MHQRSSLEVKHVDHVYDTTTHTWKYEDTNLDADAQILRGGKKLDGSDVWQSFCFVIVRKIPPSGSSPGVEPKTVITVKSPHLRTACKNVIGDMPSFSWTVDPLELSPELLISFFPRFVAYRDELRKKLDRSDDQEDSLGAVQVLVEYLQQEHQATIAQIENLLSHREITYALLYAILIPGTILVSSNPATGEPCASKLSDVDSTCGALVLNCIGLDAIDSPDGDADSGGSGSKGSQIGRVSRVLLLAEFRGVVKINTLPIYPISYHLDESGLKSALLARAQKWMSFHGVHHVHYRGTAVSATAGNWGLECKTYNKYEIDSRIMVDRSTFKQQNADYPMPQGQPVTQPYRAPSWPGTPSTPIYSDQWGSPQIQVQPQMILPPPSSLSFSADVLRVKPKAQPTELPEDELILASPVLFGFSLSDKLWLELNVEKIHPIEWSDEPFANLVLPGNRRDLLRSLAEAHNSDLDFDDFVQGKGQGLVINLFGPPGVGKTLSAEATSEHLRCPLYMIGAGDLGNAATIVENTLKRVFSVAARWKAIVLIDEADVFLEQRSLHELARNAMVAVFLRHLEYYRGILFLTTNRIKAFDPAFLSRIHVALNYSELSKDAKQQIWEAFLHKVDVEPLTPDELNDLVGRNVNGRQIKNATKTAMSFAKSRSEKLAYRHLAETLDAMEGFANDFAAISKSE